MDKKNKNKSWSESDKLELVKAAAWAWYQHGSGSDHGNPNIREFDITPIQRAYRPSRYKLEAMRNVVVNTNTNANTIEESSQTPTTTSRTSLLLDSYEIERISKRLDHLVEFSSGTEFYKQLLSIDCDDIYQKNLVPADSGIRKKKSSIFKRFLLRRAVVCGKSQDVDERAFVRRR